MPVAHLTPPGWDAVYDKSGDQDKSAYFEHLPNADGMLDSLFDLLENPAKST
jgi:hypothetical protein